MRVVVTRCRERKMREKVEWSVGEEEEPIWGRLGFVVLRSWTPWMMVLEGGFWKVDPFFFFFFERDRGEFSRVIDFCREINK